MDKCVNYIFSSKNWLEATSLERESIVTNALDRIDDEKGTSISQSVRPFGDFEFVQKLCGYWLLALVFMQKRLKTGREGGVKRMLFGGICALTTRKMPRELIHVTKR